MLENTSGDRTIRHQRVRKWVSEEDEVVAPSGYRVVEVDTASSAELRDLASYRRDLELAQSYIAAFGALEAEREETEVPTENALMIAALTMYGRAFANGVRRARVHLDGLNETQQEAHNFFIDLRNKHIAHAVNSFEQTTVIAVLTDSAFAPPRITRVGQRHVDLSPIDEELAAELVELCKFHIIGLQERIEKLHRTITDELWSSGRDTVYVLPDLGVPHGINREDVRRGRRS
jgi:hypothetical protein